MSSAFANNTGRREPVTSATIQKMLDENTQLIQAVIDHQNQGEAKKCAQYQQILHRNLVFLATVADSNMNLQGQMPQASNNAGGNMQMQQGGNVGTNMNPNMGFRHPNMAAANAGNMTSGMPMPNMQGDMQGMPANIQGNLPNLQSNVQNTQVNIQNMQGNVQNPMPNMQMNFPNMQSANIPNSMPGNMQSMPANLGGMQGNIQSGMQGNLAMQANELMAMQQGVPNLTVNNQNELQNSMMMQQQRAGLQNMQGMQFPGSMQQNPGGF